MRVNVDGKSRIETKPTGQPIEGVLSDVIEELGTRVDIRSNEEGAVATTMDGLARASLIIRKNGISFNVTFESEHGSQNKGYLINVEVSGGEDATTDDVQELGEVIIKAFREIVDVVST